MSESNIKTFKQFTSQELTPVSGTQLGSNEGGIHTDSSGNRHYVKFYKNADQAKVEALAGRIYHHMGIHTVKPEYRVIRGKHAVVTRYDDNLAKIKPEDFHHLTPTQASQIGKMFHAAVLTKNWDIVGTEHDNILKNAKTGDLHSIDTGGAFHFRAQGDHKEFGPDIDEHDSLRHKNQQASQVFNHVFSQHPHAERDGLDAVKKLDDEKVKTEFSQSGLKDWEKLHQNFNTRKKMLLVRYHGLKNA
jgi:hypothetical protein